MHTYLKRILYLFMVPGLLAGLAACGDDSRPIASYRVELTNLTANQPLSPLAVVLHERDFSAWQIGNAAGAGLEQLAEGGDPAGFLAEADASPAVENSGAGNGVVPPGSTGSVTLDGSTRASRLTVASMLVNTNDAFAGVAGVHLESLGEGDSLTLEVRGYDAGTEGNSETSASIPGPAGGGEGYNALRDDRDFVAVHPGVVTADDGLSASTLNESHRILNPVAILRITRID